MLKNKRSCYRKCIRTKIFNAFNIIKATSDPEDQAGVDDALDIVHTVGDALKIISNDDSQK